MTHRSHEPWEVEEEAELVELFNSNVSLADIAEMLGRSELAIVARLAKMHIRPAVTTEEIEQYRRLRDNNFFKSDVQTSIVNQTKSTPRKLELLIDVQQAFNRFYFVYGIVNHFKEVYIGYSGNVWHRISQHNRNVGAVATRDRGPWFPFAIHCVASEEDARKLERIIHKNFDNYIKDYEQSLKQVLAQIGLPFAINEVSRV